MTNDRTVVNERPTDRPISTQLSPFSTGPELRSTPLRRYESSSQHREKPGSIGHADLLRLVETWAEVEQPTARAAGRRARTTPTMTVINGTRS